MLNHRNLWRFDETVGRVRNDDIRAGSSQISRPLSPGSLFASSARYFVIRWHSSTFDHWFFICAVAPSFLPSPSSDSTRLVQQLSANVHRLGSIFNLLPPIILFESLSKNSISHRKVEYFKDRSEKFSILLNKILYMLWTFRTIQ